MSVMYTVNFNGLCILHHAVIFYIMSHFWKSINSSVYFTFLWPCIVSKVWRQRKPTRCNIRYLLSTSGARILQCSTPNCYQPHPAEPAQYTICSNTRSCSPEDGHNDAWNMLRQKLIINIWCWILVVFSLFKCEICVILCYFVLRWTKMKLL